MLELSDLALLDAFARLGTLSRAAEEVHISTPSVTRAMQRVEDGFGAPLFTRGKNRIELNETGRLAAQLAGQIVRQTEQAAQQVRSFDAARRTVTVCSCAPAPLWELLPKLGAAFPDKTVASSVSRNEDVERAMERGACDIAVLPYPVRRGGWTARPLLRERLFVSVPRDHALAAHETLSFSDIDGFNFLLRSELGFWDALCRAKMPASRFLVQTDEAVFFELIRASSLPCFSTDYSLRRIERLPERVHIPLADPEADVTFYEIRKGRNA